MSLKSLRVPRSWACLRDQKYEIDRMRFGWHYLSDATCLIRPR